MSRRDLYRFDNGPTMTGAATLRMTHLWMIHAH